MNIEHGKVVSFEYVLHEQEANDSSDNGPEIERSDPGSPINYLHGFPGLLNALQEGLAGQAAGTQHSIDIPPERAYGVKKDDSVHRVPLKHVIGAPTKKKLTPGQTIKVATPEGERDATVVKAGKFNVDIDTNHPLAGRHLRFVVSVLDVRDASDEELAHGHVHGAGGHDHD